MSKAIIWFLVGFGLFLFLIGLIFGIKLMWLIGLLMIGVGFYLGLGPQGILRKEQVLDTWAILIGNGQGRAMDIFNTTENLIKETKAPSLEFETRSISPGVVRGFLGKSRDFLVITDHDNIRLKPYQIFINARDYGDNLDVSWYLTHRPSLLQAILSLLPYVSIVPKVLSDLDLFDQQDLRAYVTNAHHCLVSAVEKLMTDLHQDPSKIDRKSRGFLGIS